ncbi:MAG TPA: endolytic transglycosylase MltG [Ktedonobacterales bacterium]|nr:endolytic transglycosylase MltG [Ktedonobacterales bacterium]
MKRAGLIVTIVFGLLALVGGFAATTVALDITQPAISGSHATVNFTVNKGDTTASVAANLAHDGLIRNSTLFRVWARYRHLDRGIEPGVYKLSPSMTMDAIIQDLQKGKPDEIQVQVMDSSRVEQYPAYFTGLKNFNAANFLKIAKSGKLLSNGKALSSVYWYVMPPQPHTINALEGYLYPDTYNMDANANEEDAINTMLRAFGEKLCPGPASAPDAYILDQAQCKSHAATVGDKTQVNIFTALEQKYSTKDDRQALYDALTLGSIVTRETPSFDPGSSDTQGIADVYYNRYLIAAGKLDSGGSGLGTIIQADPTVQYARDTDSPPKDGNYWTVLNDSPANIDSGSPYNTYVAANPGLPPGPIAAPVWVVLQAAADPNPDGPTPYYYFLNDTCAGHHTHFAANNSDFNALENKYLVQKQC